MTDTKQGLSAQNTTIPQAASAYFPSNVIKLDLNVPYTQKRLPRPTYVDCVRGFNEIGQLKKKVNEWLLFSLEG